jgi:hypothetical protein
VTGGVTWDVLITGLAKRLRTVSGPAIRGGVVLVGAGLAAALLALSGERRWRVQIGAGTRCSTAGWGKRPRWLMGGVMLLTGCG